MRAPRTRRQTASTHIAQIEDVDSFESKIIEALMDVIPVRRRRLQIASAIFREIEKGAIPGISFAYP
jgi:hypothetical protein